MKKIYASPSRLLFSSLLKTNKKRLSLKVSIDGLQRKYLQRKGILRVCGVYQGQRLANKQTYAQIQREDCQIKDSDR